MIRIEAPYGLRNIVVQQALAPDFPADRYVWVSEGCLDAPEVAPAGYAKHGGSVGPLFPCIALEARGA